MKSFPSCWNKTLAQLGFRRRKRKQGPHWDSTRRSLFECLEVREMLSATVDTLADVEADDGRTSLREAVADPGTTAIDFADNLFVGDAPSTILLGDANGNGQLDVGEVPEELVISSNVTITGKGADRLIIDAHQGSRVFRVADDVEASISGLTVTGGKVIYGNSGGGIYNAGILHLSEVAIIDNEAGTAQGGGLFSVEGSTTTIDQSTFEGNKAIYGGGAMIRLNSDSGTSTVDNSSFVGNQATDGASAGAGGGLYVYGAASVPTTTIKNSTFSHNSAYLSSGGLRGQGGGTVEVINCTITENSSHAGVGGTSFWTSLVVAHNTIIAGNTSDNIPSESDAQGNFSNQGSYNLLDKVNSTQVANQLTQTNGNIYLDGADPGLSDLGDHGGPTRTHALLPGSRAIDAGSNSYGGSLDQRGLRRQNDEPDVGDPGADTTDIGAVELAEFSANADLDGDHRDDEIRVDAASGTVIGITYPSNSPQVAVWAEGVAGTPFEITSVGDFDGDGRDDFAYRPNGAGWEFAISDGTQFSTISTNLWFLSNHFAAADVDHDNTDELVIWKDPSWKVLKYNRATASVTSEDWGLGLQNAGASAAFYVQDVNRDGRADLITQTADGEWHVGLSQKDSTGAGYFLQEDPADNPWADWFDDPNANGDFDADGPYQEVLDLFSDVYNNFELEIYPGLMKGVTATGQTEAGNPWDLAAYLVDQLEGALGEEPGGEDLVRIASGKVAASKDSLQDWLGTETVLASFNVISSSMDGYAVPVDASGNDVRDPTHPEDDALRILLYATGVEFNHAWVQVKVPTETGFDFINLDPSWKFKERRDGLDLEAIGFNTTNPQGYFDEYAYLSLNPSVTEENENPDKRLPLEFFEDELMDYLASTPEYQGMSLADVPRDGPIVAQVFETFEEGWGVGVTMVGAVTPYDNAQKIYDDPAERAALTHRVELSAERVAGYS